MNVVRCSNSHFYDADAYDTCPHCSAGIGRNDRQTAPLTAPMGDGDATARVVPPSQQETTPLFTPAQKPPLEQAVRQTARNDDASTVAFYEKSVGKDPVVGWLLCVEGIHKGEDFRLHTGRNFIGRAQSMDVCIAGDATVSREMHAVVVYEPKNNLYMVTSGDSKELCYLNGEVVLNPQKIGVNDVISVGSTELMFFPVCGEKFNWNADKNKDKE